MELKEETLSSEVLYRGRVVTLKKDRVRLENGVEAAREVVCHPGGVSAAALTPDNRIYLVRQFRYPTSRWCWRPRPVSWSRVKTRTRPSGASCARKRA
ncbi:MAG: hypothetical protein ACLSB9_19525 [Hydrogeniiclostridium mannosilyticum]